MSIFIIGSTGYMGSHLMNSLSENGINVRGASSTDGSGIDPNTGLLPEDYEVPVGTTAIVYMAQSPLYREAWQASHVFSVNVLSAIRAANAARKAGVLRFIYVSTGTVYAPSFMPLAESSPTQHSDWYSLSKIQGEHAVGMFRSDMEVNVVRPFGIYGPKQRGRLVSNLLNSVRNSRPITLQRRSDDPANEDGLKISLCHIEDATRILTHLTLNGGPATLNLAGEQAPSIRELVNLIGELLEIEPQVTIATTYRNFDLVADIKLLRETLPSLKFKTLQQGIKSLIES